MIENCWVGTSSSVRTKDTRLDCCTKYRYSGDNGSGGTIAETRNRRSGRSMLLVKNRGARISNALNQTEDLDVTAAWSRPRASPNICPKS